MSHHHEDDGPNDDGYKAAAKVDMKTLLNQDAKMKV